MVVSRNYALGRDDGWMPTLRNAAGKKSMSVNLIPLDSDGHAFGNGDDLDGDPAARARPAAGLEQPERGDARAGALARRDRRMSDHENGVNGAEVRPSSLLAHLRQERDERAAQRTLELAIPGWQGDDGYGLVVVLRALSFSEAQPLNRRFATMMLQGERRGDEQQQRKDAEEELERLRRRPRQGLRRYPRAHPGRRDARPRRGADGGAVPLRPAHLRAAQRCRGRRTAREAVLLVYRRNEWALQEAWSELQTFTRDAKGEESERLLGETRP